MFNNKKIDRENLNKQKHYNTKKKLETAQAWRYNADGSAELSAYKWESIFYAYTDYKKSLNWG